MDVLYSVGHSTRSADEFVALLRAYGVGGVADVRTIPASRRHPHFSGESLRERLERDGLEYRHLPDLGGLRRPRRDSKNVAWTHPAFRGYADYMEAPAFERGLSALLSFANAKTVAFMCAEALWWRCHRRLVSDALVARGAAVRHILSASEARAHELPPFARVVAGRAVYSGLF